MANSVTIESGYIAQVSTKITSHELFGIEFTSHAGLYAYGSLANVMGSHGGATTRHESALAHVSVNNGNPVDLDVADAFVSVKIMEYRGTQNITSEVVGGVVWQ